jgi:hypothetical protein
MRVDDARELATALDRLAALLQSSDVLFERDAVHDCALLETFIPGAEYAIEGVLTRGTFQPFAIFDKPDPLDGPFFEETIYVTPSRASSATQARILDAVADAARALGLVHGPVHAECRVNEAGVYVLEVAARPIGGLCAKALRFRGPVVGATESAVGAGGTTVSLEEVLMRHALGEDVSAFIREPAASAVMMLPIPRRGVFRRVDGVDAARTVDGVDDVRITAKRDAVLVPLPEGRSYLGFIFAYAPDPAGAEHAVREAHSRLEFVIEKELTVVDY